MNDKIYIKIIKDCNHEKIESAIKKINNDLKIQIIDIQINTLVLNDCVVCFVAIIKYTDNLEIENPYI